jgi:hypothetical protein
LEYKLTQSERDKLYREEIDFPFLKLAECILYDGHSYNISSDPQVIKRDIVAFLVSKIDRFDPSRGYKAFSFFNRVAKNYLIYTSIQNTKIGNTHTYIDTLDTQNKGRVLYEIYKKMDKTYDKQTEELAKSILNKLKNRLSDDMEIIFKNNKDRKVA